MYTPKMMATVHAMGSRKKPSLIRFRDPVSNYYYAGNSKQGIGTSGGSIGGFGFLPRNVHTRRNLSDEKPSEVLFCFVPAVSYKK